MKRTALLLIAITLMASGCLEKDHAQVLYVEANTLVSSRTQCQVRKGATQFRPLGTLDVAVTNEYYLFPQVTNALPASEDLTGLGTDDLRLDNNGLTFLGVEVEYDYNLESSLSGQFTFLENYQKSFFHASGFAPPGDTTPTIAKIIGYDMANELSRMEFFLNPFSQPSLDINARVVVYATMADHTVVKSGEYWFPINICARCLVYSPPGVVADSLSGDLSIPCQIGQDDGVDVRLCYNAAPPVYVRNHLDTNQFPEGLRTDIADKQEQMRHDIEADNIAKDRCIMDQILSGEELPRSYYYAAWLETPRYVPPTE